MICLWQRPTGDIIAMHVQNNNNQLVSELNNQMKLTSLSEDKISKSFNILIAIVGAIIEDATMHNLCDQ